MLHIVPVGSQASFMKRFIVCPTPFSLVTHPLFPPAFPTVEVMFCTSCTICTFLYAVRVSSTLTQYIVLAVRDRSAEIVPRYSGVDRMLLTKYCITRQGGGRCGDKKQTVCIFNINYRFCRSMCHVQLIQVSVVIKNCPKRQVSVDCLKLGQNAARTALEFDCFGLHLILAAPPC